MDVFTRAHDKRLSHKVTIPSAVGWELVSHHLNGRDKHCGYGKLRARMSGCGSAEYDHITLVGQPHNVQPISRMTGGFAG
ncbi:MAG: hypothetical protein AB1744_10170, partial [Candidatus Zixiibacteriota bacterium]